MHDFRLFACVVLSVAATACRSPQRSSKGEGLPEASASLQPPEESTALAGLDSEQIAAVLETSEGLIHCQLERRRAPKAVALFVGLATGRARWRDPRSQNVSTSPLYDNRQFFRVIPGVLIQTGCPLDNGTGEPGYRIEVESRADDAEQLSRPGALALGRYTLPPNRPDPNPPPPGHVLGSQFAVLLTSMAHLAGQVSILGRCVDLDIAARIAKTKAEGKAIPTLIRVRVGK